MKTTSCMIDQPEEIEAATNLVSSRFTPSSCEDVLNAAEQAGFSAAAYYDANPDLGNSFGSASRAALHFLAVAQSERRSFPIDLDFKGLRALSELPVANRALLNGVVASLVMAWLYRPGESFERMMERASPHLAAFRLIGARPYVLIGDSHSMLYRRSTAFEDCWLLPLHCDCSGGSAIGLFNPFSRSGYRQRIHAVMPLIEGIKGASSCPILFQFGQVDMEFVYPFRRIASGVTAFDQANFDEFVQSSITAYVGFLAEMIPRDRRPMVDVLAIFPPALADHVLRDGYVNEHVTSIEAAIEPDALKTQLKRLEWPGLAHRTRLHRQYNALLSSAAAESGFTTVSDFDRLVAVDGVVDRHFTAIQNGRDHHLDFGPTEGLAETILARITAIRAAPGARTSAVAPLVRTWSRLRSTLTSSSSRKVAFSDLTEELDPALLPPLDRPNVDAHNLTSEQREWRQNGVVILRGFLPDDLIDAYVARRRQNPNPAGWLMPTPYLHVAELRDLALYPPLMAVMRSLIGEPMLLHLALTAFRSTKRAWHQDDYLNPPFVASWYAAVWMALADITPECGPFEYLPGSHRWGLMRLEKVKAHLTEEELARREPTTGNNDWPKYAERFVTPAIERQISKSGLKPRSCLGRKGDVLVWHGRLMHQGSPPRDPTAERRSLITHYSGINHRPDMLARMAVPSGGEYAVFDHPLE